MTSTKKVKKSRCWGFGYKFVKLKVAANLGNFFSLPSFFLSFIAHT